MVGRCSDSESVSGRAWTASVEVLLGTCWSVIHCVWSIRTSRLLSEYIRRVVVVYDCPRDTESCY